MKQGSSSKRLDVRCLTIARDTEKRTSSGSEYRSKLLETAARLLALCQRNGIKNDMFTYSVKEQKQVIDLIVQQDMLS